MRLKTRTLLFAAAGIALAGQAFAHAHLKSAAPAPDSTIAASPDEIDLTFSEGVNLKFSGVRLIGPDKAEIETGAGMLMENDTMLMVPVGDALAAGTYTVDWHALSTDGHKSKGQYSFTVKP